MSSKEILNDIINNFEPSKFVKFFREKSRKFKPLGHSLSNYNNEDFTAGTILGVISLEDSTEFIICNFKVIKPLSERSGKKAQYILGKKILKETARYVGGIFIFYDDKGDFRFSLIYDIPLTNGKRDWSNFRRFTYLVADSKPNKTFRLQFEKAEFSEFEKILKAFSIDAVTDEFYNSFKPNFDQLSENVIGTKDTQLKQDFVLLFIIRIIFLGFVQKKLWLNKDEEFIYNYWKEYKSKYYGKDLFYTDWLKPLFFESLNYAPGRKVFNRSTPFSESTALALQMAPYLNGELFKEKVGFDDQDLTIPDRNIELFLEFLFSYNFTIEENTLYDQDLELNPEFLGIIFERLVNKEAGAVYTPRTEVDFMCRISLVKWLHKNSTVNKKRLYHLFFDKRNDNEIDELLNSEEKDEILSLLKNITICDPAAGSGAFPVGMLQVLDAIIHILSDNDSSNSFERKKEIISRSLYGVEVKSWAVWINQLRLWLSLFVDMPDEFKSSFEPLLPNLEFKIRRGDSIVQMIGNKLFLVESHANISPDLKRKITELKKEKSDFFYGKGKLKAELIRKKESDIFKAIIDEQILDKKKTLRAFGGNSAEKDMFGVVLQQDDLRLQLDGKKKEHLREEIINLEEELKSFKDVHPLVWNIEFAEIFYDKNGFDIIIGNPPYVRQESITDPDKKINPVDYKELLRQTVYSEYPSHFYVKKDNSKLKNKIDGKSDLYTFFYLKSLKLLNENGVHTFICSNSWLDVGFGAWLQQFILENTKLHFVIDNQSKRSFSNVDVNTLITVLESPNKELNPTHISKFIVFKSPFEEIVNTENLLLIEYAGTITTDDDFRVYPISHNELKEAGTVYENDTNKKLGQGTYEGDKWGAKYFRLPYFLFHLIQNKKLIPLSYLCKLDYGNKPGIVDFFIIDSEKKKKFNIEDRFLVKIISSTKEIDSILINPNQIKKYIFKCDLTKTKLKAEGFNHAYEYVLWGEQQQTLKKASHTKKGIPWPNVPSVKSNYPEWYCIALNSPGDFIIPRLIRERFFFAFNKYSLIDTDMFFHGSFYKREYFDFGVAILNSTIVYLMLEIYGRQNIEGRFNIYGPDLKPLPIPDFELFNANQRAKIVSLFNQILHRDMKKIRDEVNMDDRRKMDDIIFDALNLTKAERAEVYYSVTELVQNRLDKANSV